MIKDTVPTPMEPFTSEEEGALVSRLDALPVSALESYIASARNSLGNQSLAATWRPRIEFAMKHAELSLVKAVAAAALVEAQPPVVEAPAAKAKPKPKTKKAAAAEAAQAALAAEAEAEAEAEAD